MEGSLGNAGAKCLPLLDETLLGSLFLEGSNFFCLKYLSLWPLRLQEEVAKNLLAEFNLGCDIHQTEHVYRVYVATFLGFGGNAARQRYEDRIFASTVQKNR